MSNNTIIISYSDVSPLEAVDYVSHVMRNGRVSGNKDHFCWLTCFKDSVNVSVRKRRSKASPDSFVVHKEPINPDTSERE